MRIYWTLNSIPELHGLDPGKQSLRWEKCCRQTLKHWQVWVAMVASIAIGVLGLLLLAWLVVIGHAAQWPRSGLVLIFIVGVALFGLIGAIVVRHAMYHVGRAYLRRFCEGWCSDCGYDLRGNLAAGLERCPECGKLINMQQRRWAEWQYKVSYRPGVASSPSQGHKQGA